MYLVAIFEMNKSIEELGKLAKLAMMKLCNINFKENELLAKENYFYEDNHLYTDM